MPPPTWIYLYSSLLSSFFLSFMNADNCVSRSVTVLKCFGHLLLPRPSLSGSFRLTGSGYGLSTRKRMKPWFCCLFLWSLFKTEEDVVCVKPETNSRFKINVLD